MQEQTIFTEAMEKEDPVERAAFLDQVCAGDAALRQRIDRLLERHDQADGLLESPAAARWATVDPVSVRLGTVIGPYKLMEQIGEGGMGLVFVAEQHQPVRRKVALKVIKPGMDTRAVVARFEAERQALALMDHPSIARVLDGGESADGRPYFVMELVKGVPITQFCDDNRLSTRERLELFIHVCQAVQHAHQKGIIHRDLKPSNVMAISQDGKPVVKVIDFGVAKAIGQQLTDKTIYTQFSQLIGTPLYMSPEQAGESAVDVDTRSDIYSLGVVLYELLTGTTPFDKELKEASYDEIRRIIREAEPARPSTRLSTLGAAAATVSANRHSDPKRLSQLFRGELDWIVMKCLEKDRNRRYETPSTLASDVKRYLSDEPVQACPPSRGYRLRKWLRKHRAAVLTGAALALVLVLTSLGLAVNNLMMRREQALTHAANERLQDNLELSLKALDEIYLQVLEDRMGRGPEESRDNQELLIKALDFYEQFAEGNDGDPNVRREVASAYDRAGVLHMRLGHDDKAAAALGRAEEAAARLIADFPGEPEPKGLRAEVHLHKGQLAYKGPLLAKEPRQGETTPEEYRKGIELLEPLIENGPLGLKYWQTLASLHSSLASFAQHSGDLAEGKKHYLRAIAVQRAVVGKADTLPSKLFAMQQLAAWHANLGNLLGGGEWARHLDDASDELGQALALLTSVHTQAAALPGYQRGRLPGFRGGPPIQSDLARVHWNLGGILRDKGQCQAAESEFGQADKYGTQVVKDWPREPLFRRRLAVVRRDLGVLLFEQGKRPEASQQYRQSIHLLAELDEQFPGVSENEQLLSDSLDLMAELLLDDGDQVGAAEHFRQARDIKESLVARRPNDAEYASALAWFLSVCPERRLRNPDRAVALAEKAAAHFPENGWYSGVLGVAQYRNGQLREAVTSLEKANRLRPYGYEGFWLYLAMAHWQLGEREAARTCYDRAVELMKGREFPAHVANRIHAEARDVLGLQEQKN